MINHFLKLGGVNTIEEFYRKFPTEAHFDEHIKMKHGGMYAYDSGGEAAAPSYAYGGVSIVDFLNSKGKVTDFASRKKLAESLGVQGYTGKPSENLNLIKALQDKPELLNSYGNAPKVAKTSSSKSGNEQWHAPMVAPSQKPSMYSMPFLGGNRPVQKSAPVKKASASQQKPAVIQRPAVTQKVVVQTPQGPVMKEVVLDDRNFFEKFYQPEKGHVSRFKLPEDVYNAYQTNAPKNKKNKFGIISKNNAVGYFFDQNGNLIVQDEVGLGKDMGEEQPVFYKTMTTPSGTYRMTRPTFKAAVADKMTQGYDAKNFFYIDNVDPNKRLIDAPGSTRPDGVRQAMHGIPMHLRGERLPLFGNNNPDDNYMSAGCVNCRRPLLDNPYFNDIREANLYVTPRTSPLPQKKKKQKMGGEPCYNCGGMYADGGEGGPGEGDNPQIFGIPMPQLLKSGVQILDPTGLTSWGDAGRAIGNAWDHPSWGNVGTAALETFGAFPVIGKFGKIGKIEKLVSDISKTASDAEKAIKAAQKAKKALDAASDVDKAALAAKAAKAAKKVETTAKAAEAAKAAHAAAQPGRIMKSVQTVEKYNPVNLWFNKMPGVKVIPAYTEKLLQNVPRVQKTGQAISDVNKVRRFAEGLSAGQDATNQAVNYFSEKKNGGQTFHPGGNGTYYQGTYFDDGGTFIPDYGAMAYGQLPQYEMGKAMYGSGVMELGGPTYSEVTQYNHQGIVPAFDWMQDGGSPLYSTQGQQLRNFMNTVGYKPGGWMPNHIELPPVGKYDDGGMAPDQQQVPVGMTPNSGGIDPQQVMEITAQKLQQGEQPQQVMQELVQAGVPQDMAMQIIQQVMQQIQASQGQQAGEEMMENPSQQNPQEELEEGMSPQAMYGLGMKYGGVANKKDKFAKNYKVGGEYDMSESDVQKLIAQGYTIEYL